MATASPFNFAQDLLGKLPPALNPPEWALQEMQRRVVLLINHVLMQEPEAMKRLVRQQGRALSLHWDRWHLRVRISAAGLFQHEPVSEEAPAADLVLTFLASGPWQILEPLLQGSKPEVQVQGDVQLAADINWLIDHVRWDIEADLARIMGDVPAHVLAEGARGLWQAIAKFVAAKTTAKTPPAESAT